MPTSPKAVSGHEMSDDRAVVDRRSIPFAGDRVRVDREGLVHRTDLRPTEICHRRTRRYRGNEPTVRIAEARSLILPELNAISILVDITMVQAAQ